MDPSGTLNARKNSNCKVLLYTELIFKKPTFVVMLQKIYQGVVTGAYKRQAASRYRKQKAVKKKKSIFTALIVLTNPGKNC